MDAGPKYLGLGQDTDAANSINLHLHVRIAIGVTQVCQVGSPCRILGIAFHNDSVFVEGIRKSQRRFGFLPGVQIVGLLAAEPVGKRTPHICTEFISIKPPLGMSGRVARTYSER